MNSHSDPAGPETQPAPRQHPVRDAVGLIVFGTLFGLAANALSPRGIPLVGDFSRGAALANRSEEELKELPPVVELADVKAAIAEGDSLLAVLDARAPDAYAEGHLPGALNLSVENLDEAQATLASLGSEPRDDINNALGLHPGRTMNVEMNSIGRVSS